MSTVFNIGDTVVRNKPCIKDCPVCFEYLGVYGKIEEIFLSKSGDKLARVTYNKLKPISHYLFCLERVK